jgi:hypothetical protein
LGNGTLDDKERRYDDDEGIPVACNLFPLLVDNIHDPCNLQMTSFLNHMPCQRCWIWVDRPPVDGETDMRIPFEGNRMLVAAYNLFHLNPLMILLISPLNDEVLPFLGRDFQAASRVPSLSPPIAFDILCAGYLVRSYLLIELTYLNEWD